MRICRTRNKNNKMVKTKRMDKMPQLAINTMRRMLIVDIVDCSILFICWLNWTLRLARNLRTIKLFKNLHFNCYFFISWNSYYSHRKPECLNKNNVTDCSPNSVRLGRCKGFHFFLSLWKRRRVKTLKTEKKRKMWNVAMVSSPSFREIAIISRMLFTVYTQLSPVGGVYIITMWLMCSSHRRNA